jgi:putative colanic acid biosynthesis UDP-glucose lipid carrier transferase
MTINELPLIALIRRVLNPLIIMGSLYLCTVLSRVPFSSYELVLMVLAHFIAASAYQFVDPYQMWRSGRMLAYARDVIIGWMITAGFLLLLGMISGMGQHYNKQVLLLWFVTAPVSLLLVHMAARKLGSAPNYPSEVRSVILIGANTVSVKLAATISRNPNHFMNICGFFDDRSKDRWPEDMEHPMLGGMADIAAYVRENNIKIIMISQPMSAQPRIRKLLDELQDTTASVYFLPDIHAFELMQARVDNIGGIPVIAICESPFTGLNGILKRLSDIVIGGLIQILLLPIMLVIAIAVKVSSPGPIIFRQRRYGLNGEEIIVYKFRSMTVTEDGARVVQATKGDQRVTRVGAFLRRSSLDELPQFINVLQGRMSIVGPRPHAVAHNEQYRKLIKGYMLRHKVKPGITGWAQVNGLRGETETLGKMEARIHHDLDYLRKWSLWLDIWIIFLTVRVVAKRDNAH